MSSARKPWWQQATAVVSLSASGAVTGFSFAHKATADTSSPSKMMIHLMALDEAGQPVKSGQAATAGDAKLRSAIVSVARYYLRMAAGKTPAEMEAVIWEHDTIDGADHGQSCAAFASLTLELGARVVGQRSWVTGGTTYPWPLHKWADVRVDPNPDSLGITSVLQDAQAYDRWHPLGDGYQPLPGDWVLFHGHVEVVTGYSGGILHTIGGDSLPDYSVNAHEYQGSLTADGVAGFVNNGDLAQGGSAASSGGASSRAASSRARSSRAASNPDSHSRDAAAQESSTNKPAQHGKAPVAHRHAQAQHGATGAVDIPGTSAAAPESQTGAAAPARTAVAGNHASPGDAAIPGLAPSAGQAGTPRAAPMQPASAVRSTSPPNTAAPAAFHHSGLGTTQIPGLPGTASSQSPGTVAPTSHRYTRHHPSPPPAPTTPPAQATPPAQTTPPAQASPPAQSTPPAQPAPSAAPAQSPPSGQVSETSAQQAFINEVAPGAIAAQHEWGVPASVTIAQAIDESGWGQSELATRDHNLFGIKGDGPAGTDAEPTHEYVHGRPVQRTASFRVYRDLAQSITDHGRLLATSGYYTRAMADRSNPDAFAAALTGVYATDPDYGAKLIGLMRRYDLYRYDTAAPARPGSARAAQSRAPEAAQSPAAQPPAAPSQVASSDGATRPRPPRRQPAPAVAPTGTEAGAAAIPRIPAPAPAAAAQTTPPHTTPPHTTAPHTPQPRTRPTARISPGPDSWMDTGLGAARVASPGPASARRAASDSPAARRPAPRRAAPRRASSRPGKYQTQVPPAVQNAFAMTARLPLLRAEPLYKDIAEQAGIRWQLLAACDWMQCKAQPRYSPVHGEKLGTVNADGTCYRTKSEALDQCADDLIDLSWAVYQIDLTQPRPLSVRELANVFAAFRWGGLLQAHHTSAMEFPYSVAGLTDQHAGMRWPNIADSHTPDKPGSRFRQHFGAVPVVLILKYPATA